MDIKTLTQKIEKVSALYSEKFGITRDNDWFILKLQEEIGELTQSYLMLIGQARNKENTQQELEENFHKEVADVFAHVLLLAKQHKIDLEKELEQKWLIWNRP